jgi:hypothetical protein
LTTINTTEDFLTLMRENQEFREAARQAILTEELLALPAVFSTFASEMRTDFRRLEGDVSEVRSDVRQLQEGQKRLEGDVSEKVRSDVRSDIGRLEDGQKRLEEGQKRLSDRVDSIRGTSLEQRLSTKLVPLLGREFNVRRVYPIWSPGVIDVSGNTREFLDRVEQALEDGIVDDDEEARLRVTDLIMRSQRKTDRSTLWFTVEASGVINDDDITRSQQSANAIEKIYGQDTIPIVYGYGIHEDQKRLADELGVQVYLDPEGD